MYALLGLMLAFTYTFTLSRADMRKAALIDESNALSSAFLTAGMMEELTRNELRTALLEYTKTRVVNTEASGNVQKIKKIIKETSYAQKRI